MANINYKRKLDFVERFYETERVFYQPIPAHGPAPGPINGRREALRFLIPVLKSILLTAVPPTVPRISTDRRGFRSEI